MSLVVHFFGAQCISISAVYKHVTYLFI